MPGFHLPYIAGAADGLFAEYGLDVEVLEPAGGPDNVKRVAKGQTEFCLTSVLHYLVARAEHGPAPARFVAVVAQRSPMAGLVVADSELREPADLAGRRVAGPATGRLVIEYLASLAGLGVAAPTIVPDSEGGGPAALARCEVDVVAEFAELTPRVRRQSGVKIRPVRVGADVYSSGLVAGDHVPDKVVARMRAAVAAAVERQRQAPETGVQAFRRRYPATDPEDVVESWYLTEPLIFTGLPVGSMDAARWRATLEHYAAGHGLPSPPAESVYRLEPTPDLTHQRA